MVVIKYGISMGRRISAPQTPPLRFAICLATQSENGPAMTSPHYTTYHEGKVRIADCPWRPVVRRIGQNRRFCQTLEQQKVRRACNVATSLDDYREEEYVERGEDVSD